MKHCLKDFLQLLCKIKEAIEQNLEENEFEGVSEFETEILKQQI